MERVLSEHIQGRYELIGIQPGEVIIKKKSYDFRHISKAEADELYASGCRYLKPVNDKVKKQIQEDIKKLKIEPTVSKNGLKPVLNGDELLKLSKKKEKPASS